MGLNGSLRDKHLANAKRLITHLGRMKLAFTISSLSYCAAHWLIFHGLSVYVLSGALAFGAIAAMVVSRLSRWLSWS
jgi:hypothetical protein